MNNEYADEIDGYMEEWLLLHTKPSCWKWRWSTGFPSARSAASTRCAAAPDWPAGSRKSTVPAPAPLSYPNAPYTLPDAPSTATTPAPALGQHNEEVYTGELGFTHEQLVALHQTGII